VLAWWAAWVRVVGSRRRKARSAGRRRTGEEANINIVVALLIEHILLNLRTIAFLCTAPSDRSDCGESSRVSIAKWPVSLSIASLFDRIMDHKINGKLLCGCKPFCLSCGGAGDGASSSLVSSYPAEIDEFHLLYIRFNDVAT
jgi:hypothetical protein